jgi:protoporphyrinogen/coproporphyrinogen III oxidase
VPDRGHAVVVGGGVAGLVFALDASEAGYRVTVLERATRFGGVVRSERLGPVTVDVGAESFALTRPDVLELADRLGLGAAVERPATHQAHVLSGGRHLPLPPGVLGVPGDPADIGRLL